MVLLEPGVLVVLLVVQHQMLLLMLLGVLMVLLGVDSVVLAPLRFLKSHPILWVSYLQINPQKKNPPRGAGNCPGPRPPPPPLLPLLLAESLCLDLCGGLDF